MTAYTQESSFSSMMFDITNGFWYHQRFQLFCEPLHTIPSTLMANSALYIYCCTLPPFQFFSIISIYSIFIYLPWPLSLLFFDTLTLTLTDPSYTLYTAQNVAMPPKKIPSTTSNTDAIKDTLHLDVFAKQFMGEHIRDLIRMYTIHSMKDDVL